MGSQLFGPLDRNSAIRVGYIDPNSGLVEGLSIAEANEHARLDPGTTFIFKSGDNVLKYFNINGVNALTAEDLLRNEPNCPGINQKEKVGPPTISIKGGGGVGAVGNPIIGEDGSILAVDVIRTGHGYVFPPIVTTHDDSHAGNGAVLRAVLGSNVGETFQYYDRPEDFEEPLTIIPDRIPAGTLWGPNGEDLGEWNPGSVLPTSNVDDPILNEVQDFEKIVRALEGGFFNTRKNKPSRITSNDPKVSGSVYHVDYGAAWGDFMNRYAISPKPPSNVRGSDFAGILFTYEWNLDFPTTGDYTIRGARDNKGKLYIDNQFISDLDGFKGSINTIKRFYEAGTHTVRVDLLNVPQYEKVKVKPVAASGDYTIVYRGLNSANVDAGKNEKRYPIAVAKPGSLGRGLRAAIKSVSKKSIKFTDSTSQNDTDAEFKILSTSPGVTAKFSGDGSELIVKGKGDVTLRLEWNDDPNSNGEAVGDIKVAGERWKQTAHKNKKGDVTKTINVGSKDTKEVLRGLIVSNDRRRVKMKDGHGDDINSTFFIESSTNNAKFSSDGRKLEYDGAGEITLTLKWDDNPRTAGVAVDKIEIGDKVWDQKGGKGSVTRKITVKPTGSSTGSSTGGQQSNLVVFDTVEYQNKADRKLWRTNVYGRGGFINEFGVCPFNTRKSLPDNPYAGTHVIRWEHVKFPKDGNYIIEIEVDDDAKVFIGNRSGDGAMAIGNGLRSIESGGDEVILEKTGFKPNSNRGTGKSTYTRFFKAGKYRIRTELTQKEGGRFNFNPDSNGNIKSDVKARFVKEGNGYALKVTGNGSAEIDFKLKTDDNPRTSGSSLTDIKIGSLTISRTRDGGIKERETITKSGFFEAGRTYPVKVRGSSPTTGSRLVGNDRIEFDDNIGNGFDLNAFVSIGKIKNITNTSGKGSNPMSFAMRITSDFEDERTIVSPRSWNQNPMGVALTIDAPPPAVPQEPPPIQEGRCPPNPIWTTRSSGSEDQWYPVTYPRAWSDFMDRYAISPIKPLAQPNTDGGGIVYSNTWKINVEFAGFYGLKGTVDNGGRILVDGREIIRGGYFKGAVFSEARNVGKLHGFRTNNPSTTKFYLGEGQHTITVEVENRPTATVTQVNKKIFNTQDWQGDARAVKGKGSVNISYNGGRALSRGLSVSRDGKRVFMKDGDGNDTNATFSIESSDNNAKFSSDGKSIEYRKEGTIKVKLKWDDNPNTAGVAVESIDVGGVKLKQRGRKGDVSQSFKVEGETRLIGVTKSGANKGGVIYSGPDLFKFNHPRWSKFMNNKNVSPYLPPLDEDNSSINGVKSYTWSNVDFPEDGRYNFEFQADNIGKLFINDKLITEVRSFRGEPQKTTANLSRGKYNIRVELDNVPSSNNVFNSNPAGFGLTVHKLIDVRGDSQPWKTNPVGISAILISPPCPRKINGRGLVTDIIVEEPGNGYKKPESGEGGYPVLLKLAEVIVEDPGINYNCGVDQLEIVPDNGAVLNYECNAFGRISKVIVESPGSGFIETPIIRMPSETGVNFKAKPVFEVVRDPIEAQTGGIPPEKLLQVTDLVGLKQTGYYEGRPYYGAVFYKDGIKYAGYYETAGDLVQIYDTLQESIDAEVTTPPSAIQRQGTDTNSNNPRLNLPGTPENLT